MKSFIIPIFIPFAACPHRCVFCEQHRITSQNHKLPKPETVKAIIEAGLASPKFDPERGAEVAFYGGTFTGLSLQEMEHLFSAVKLYMDRDLVHGIRVSTRPDFVQHDKLEFMKRFQVINVELGAQSMNDMVLRASQRGHTSQDTERAVEQLKNYGFGVGIQLMPGLPQDSEDIFRDTVTKVIELKPDFVRLYPTIVIRGTVLARYFKEGTYVPLSMDKAVSMCAEAVERFEENGIRVIRIGLMNTPSLLKGGEVLAGPWHPSFGAMVRSEVYHKGIRKILPPRGMAKALTIRANANELPLLKGYKNEGILRIERLTGARVVNIEADEKIPKGKIEVGIR